MRSNRVRACSRRQHALALLFMRMRRDTRVVWIAPPGALTAEGRGMAALLVTRYACIPFVLRHALLTGSSRVKLLAGRLKSLSLVRADGPLAALAVLCARRQCNATCPVFYPHLYGTAAWSIQRGSTWGTSCSPRTRCAMASTPAAATLYARSPAVYHRRLSLCCEVRCTNRVGLCPTQDVLGRRTLVNPTTHPVAPRLLENSWRHPLTRCRSVNPPTRGSPACDV